MKARASAGSLMFSGTGIGAGAHRAVEGLDVLRAVQGEDADAVAAADAARGQPGGYRVAVGIQLGVGDLARGRWFREVHDRSEPLTLPSPLRGEEWRRCPSPQGERVG